LLTVCERHGPRRPPLRTVGSSAHPAHPAASGEATGGACSTSLQRRPTGAGHVEAHSHAQGGTLYWPRGDLLASIERRRLTWAEH
jgi:hypothetical protein